MRSPGSALAAFMLTALAGCATDYSPNTYASNAVQQANKVEPGVVVGFRQVRISASGTVGAVTGGAAGGILGSQSGVGGIGTALTALGGTFVGTLAGTAIEHATDDTTGWEYIVRKSNGDMLSVTQREPTPIPIGQKVLVITGNQARIVPDYSVALDRAPASPHGDKDAADNDEKATAKEATPATATPVATAPQTLPESAMAPAIPPDHPAPAVAASDPVATQAATPTTFPAPPPAVTEAAPTPSSQSESAAPSSPASPPAPGNEREVAP